MNELLAASSHELRTKVELICQEQSALRVDEIDCDCRLTGRALLGLPLL